MCQGAQYKEILNFSTHNCIRDMNREIKFRFWDIVNKKMYPEMERLHTEPVNAWFVKAEQQGIIVLQSTNLKDKNGKEIYEGDIVVKNGYIWFDDDEPNYRGTVEWIYNGWQVVAHCINPNKRGISDGINQWLNEDGFDEDEKSEWEVIGNIYEHPNLLTV